MIQLTEAQKKETIKTMNELLVVANGSCTCGARTPDFAMHSVGCMYGILMLLHKNFTELVKESENGSQSS